MDQAPRGVVNLLVVLVPVPELKTVDDKYRINAMNSFICLVLLGGISAAAAGDDPWIDARELIVQGVLDGVCTHSV